MHDQTHHKSMPALLVAALGTLAVIAFAVFLMTWHTGPTAEQAHTVRAVGDVVQATGLTSRSVHGDPMTASGCVSEMIVTTREQVGLYRDAGDPVLTSKDGRVGVVLEMNSRTSACNAEVQRGLTSLR